MVAHSCCRDLDSFRALVSHRWSEQYYIYNQVVFLDGFGQCDEPLQYQHFTWHLGGQLSHPSKCISYPPMRTHCEVVLISARFMFLASFSSRSQQASSTIALLASRTTPMASELASTQTVNSFPSSYWIIPSHSGHSFGQHASQSSITHFTVPSQEHRGCTSFHRHHCHSEATACGEVAHCFPHTEKVLWRVMNVTHPSFNKVSFYCHWWAILALSPHSGEVLAPCMLIWNTQNVFWLPRKT